MTPNRQDEARINLQAYFDGQMEDAGLRSEMEDRIASLEKKLAELTANEDR